MRNARSVETETGALGSAPNSKTTASFLGTANPRHLRAIHALLRRPMPREHLDRAAGASNGPALVAELRSRGLELPCQKVPCLDRDGREVQRGVYRFTQRDRIRIARWLAHRDRSAA
jgi:hypothetical protein